MRAVVVYRDNTEHARAVDEFLHFFKSVTGRELETLSPDTRDGISFCQVYDIVQYPTVIALADDGVMLQKWSGVPLPTVNEVSYYR